MMNKIAFCGPSTPSVVCRRCLLARKLPGPGKPPILPPAKTKMYNVTQFKWQDPADVADLLWRRHIYNNAIASMRRIFREEVQLRKTFTVGLEDAKREEMAELDILLALNEQRNEQLDMERAEREKVAVQQLEEETLKQIEHRLHWQEQNAEERTREVLAVIEKSKTEFVSRQNLEQCIFDALEQPVGYEYAIDLNGMKMENPVPDKYPHSVAKLPNVFEQPLDYGPSTDEQYRYKKGRMGAPRQQKWHNKNQQNNDDGGGGGRRRGGGGGQNEALATTKVGG